MQNFIPAHHGFVILGHDFLQALVEVGLQVLIVLHAVGVDEGLNLRIGVPLLAVDFVAADVEVGVGKEPGHFRNELFKELVSRFLRGIHDRIDVPWAASVERVGAGTARQFRITDEPRTAVSGNVELGDHADAAIVRVGDEVANFVLRIEHAVGAHARELGKYFALDAESLVIGKMPVQDVQFHCGHRVEVALEHVDGNEVAADVDERCRARESAVNL